MGNTEQSTNAGLGSSKHYKLHKKCIHNLGLTVLLNYSGVNI